jgi:transcriptional regulator with XRE-family HTH domain
MDLEAVNDDEKGVLIMKNRLKEARFFAKKPQIRLWLETGIHYSTISRIECGYLKPTEGQKQKLSEALGVETDWLFPPENEKSVENK